MRLTQTDAYCSNRCDQSARSTMLTRQRALQRLMRLKVAREIGDARIHALDEQLGARPSRGWHDAGTAIGGEPGRASQRPTFPPAALEAVFGAAERESVESAALAAVLAFSGLDLAQLCRLRWGDLVWGNDQMRCEIVLGSGRGAIRYFVLGPAVPALLRLYVQRPGASSESAIFPGRSPESAVTPRAVRKRMGRWSRAAGWPEPTRHQLLSALAVWLRDRGLDDHSIKISLGRRRVKSVDDLLRPHRRLEDQVRVQEALSGLLRPHVAPPDE